MTDLVERYKPREGRISEGRESHLAALLAPS